MERHRRFLIGAFASALLSVSVLGYAARARPTDARVRFQAIGPAGLKIEGTTSELELSDDAKGNIVISVPLRNLTTGIDIRDRHMKDKYLEVGKYPVATLTVAENDVKMPAEGGNLAFDVPGTLGLHGQTKAVSVHCELKDGSPSAVGGKFRINMNDVGISVPVYLGVTVKPDVDVDVHFLLGSRLAARS